METRQKMTTKKDDSFFSKKELNRVKNLLIWGAPGTSLWTWLYRFEKHRVEREGYNAVQRALREPERGAVTCLVVFTAIAIRRRDPHLGNA
jgi:hypothetical protein